MMRNSECGIRNAEPESVIRNPQSAFTLLEVMVAVAILAMVLVSLLGVKNRSMQNVLLADHITTATMLAKRELTDMLVTGATATVQESEEEGEFTEEEFKGYTWKKTVVPLTIETETGTVVIKEIRMAVLWKEGDRQEMVELKSYE